MPSSCLQYPQREYICSCEWTVFVMSKRYRLHSSGMWQTLILFMSAWAPLPHPKACPHVVFAFVTATRCVPTILEGVADLGKSGHASKLMIELQHLLLWTVSWRIGSAVTRTRNTKLFAYAYISGEEFCCFWELSAVAHPLTEKPVEGNGTCLNALIT